jgi:hypothetical protein
MKNTRKSTYITVETPHTYGIKSKDPGIRSSVCSLLKFGEYIS